MRWISVLVFLFGLCTFAQAQSNTATTISLPIDRQRPTLDLSWSIEEITDGSVPAEIVTDTREIARNGLPDGRVEIAPVRNDIEEAWYSEPTERYRHAVLGDGVEAGALRVKTYRGQEFTFRLPRTEVFEDITPRLADLDGDGRTEVITILSSATEGASVAVFGLNGSAFVKLAQSPYIGRSNRWLNIAGITRFTGNRAQEIAIVETPHLAGLLKLYSYSTGSTTLRNSMIVPGFSNHQIGSGELRLSALGYLDNNNRPELIVPSLNRQTLFIVSLTRRGLRLLSRIDLPARVDKAIAIKGEGSDMELTVGLDDGKIYALRQQ
ncbi:MAG: hypothetical protein AAF412_01520 [Pseudomonadota bacterium]